jgi:hypothetical protein
MPDCDVPRAGSRIPWRYASQASDARQLRSWQASSWPFEVMQGRDVDVTERTEAAGRRRERLIRP